MATSERICFKCESAFSTKDPRQKFCSRTCARESRLRKRGVDICAEDGCDRSVYARGCCEPHYRKRLADGLERVRHRSDGTCSVEGCQQRHHARGLCRSHHGIRRRTGDPTTPPQRIRGGRICLVEDCPDRASAQGYCPVHYQRIVVRGGTAGTPVDRGDRPCAWCGEPFAGKGTKLYCSIAHSRIAKSLRNAEYLYGITMQEYRAMWLRQGGVCAVCRKPERGRREGNGLLNIDHDHVSGHIRGLLCSHCNRAIGLCGDDPKVLRAAAKYVQETRQLRLIV